MVVPWFRGSKGRSARGWYATFIYLKVQGRTPLAVAILAVPFTARCWDQVVV
jgi:hypothetical protein